MISCVFEPNLTRFGAIQVCCSVVYTVDQWSGILPFYPIKIIELNPRINNENFNL